MTTKERNERVDQLLHDAQHDEDGAELALRIGRGGSARKFTTWAKAWRDEAKRIDPQKLAPAWAVDELLQERLRLAKAPG